MTLPTSSAVLARANTVLMHNELQISYVRRPVPGGEEVSVAEGLFPPRQRSLIVRLRKRVTQSERNETFAMDIEMDDSGSGSDCVGTWAAARSPRFLDVLPSA